MANWSSVYQSLLVACLAGILPAAAGSPQEDEQPVLSTGGANAATDLKEETRCSDETRGVGIALLSWSIAENPGTQQRIDMTMYREGFKSGKFDTVGVYPPDQSSVEIKTTEPGINYYWRVLTLTPQGWAPSPVARCKGPVCPSDSPKGPPGVR